MKQSKLHGSHLVPVRVNDAKALHLNVYVRGYVVRLAALDAVGYAVGKCYVHRDYVPLGSTDKPRGWTVTDAVSGASIVQGIRSPDDAILQAVIKLHAAGSEKYHKRRREDVELRDNALANWEANEAALRG